jgi:hypothetical protein
MSRQLTPGITYARSTHPPVPKSSPCTQLPGEPLDADSTPNKKPIGASADATTQPTGTNKTPMNLADKITELIEQHTNMIASSINTIEQGANTVAEIKINASSQAIAAKAIEGELNIKAAFSNDVCTIKGLCAKLREEAKTAAIAKDHNSALGINDRAIKLLQDANTMLSTFNNTYKSSIESLMAENSSAAAAAQTAAATTAEEDVTMLTETAE